MSSGEAKSEGNFLSKMEREGGGERTRKRWRKEGVEGGGKDGERMRGRKNNEKMEEGRRRERRRKRWRKKEGVKIGRNDKDRRKERMMR